MYEFSQRIPLWLRWVMTPLFFAAVIILAVVLIGGPAGDYDPSEEEVREQLAALPYEVQYLDVPHTGGTLVAGTVRARGERVPFAVVSNRTSYEGKIFRNDRREVLTVAAGAAFISFQLPKQPSEEFVTIYTDALEALCEPSGESCF